jgi:hypothetical protein
VGELAKMDPKELEAIGKEGKERKEEADAEEIDVLRKKYHVQ